MLFNNVKSITIPEGTVTQIALGSIILWKKEDEPEPEPSVDPTSGVMDFGNNTTVDEETGVVEFETTPTLDDDGVLDFESLII